MHIIASFILLTKFTKQIFLFISVENGGPPQIRIENQDTRKTDNGMSWNYKGDKVYPVSLIHYFNSTLK